MKEEEQSPSLGSSVPVCKVWFVGPECEDVEQHYMPLLNRCLASLKSRGLESNLLVFSFPHHSPEEITKYHQCTVHSAPLIWILVGVVFCKSIIVYHRKIVDPFNALKIFMTSGMATGFIAEFHPTQRLISLEVAIKSLSVRRRSCLGKDLKIDPQVELSYRPTIDFWVSWRQTTASSFPTIPRNSTGQTPFCNHISDGSR